MSSHARPHSHLDDHGSAPLVRIAAISLAVTACLLALKLTLGIISGSIAVISDAIDSATDLTAGAAALFSVRFSSRPADEEHPYGHGKIESVSAAVAATIIFIGGGFVVFQAVRRLLGETPDINVAVGLVAMVIAALANIVVGHFMRREAKRSGSIALHAESTHLQTNVVQAGTIIAGLALVGVTGEKVFDPLVALGLAGYMGWTAIGLVRTALEDILDSALPANDLRAIYEVLHAHQEEIRGFHRMRTRRSGATRHVDMHILIDSGKPFEEVHEIGDHIESEIQARLPGSIVVIHLEPDEGQEREPLEALLADGG
jgi:cation diffusion facilitator family transporter